MIRNIDDDLIEWFKTTAQYTTFSSKDDREMMERLLKQMSTPNKKVCKECRRRVKGTTLYVCVNTGAYVNESQFCDNFLEAKNGTC